MDQPETVDYLVTAVVHLPHGAWIQEYGPPIDENTIAHFLDNGIFVGGHHVEVELSSLIPVQGMRLVRPRDSAQRVVPMAPDFAGFPPPRGKHHVPEAAHSDPEHPHGYNEVGDY